MPSEVVLRMLENNTFNASWGRSLKISTLLTLLLFPGVFLFGAYMRPDMQEDWKAAMVILPFAVIGISALFSIRNYQILENRLVIQRIGWQSTIDLSDLKSAEANPHAMSKSIRLFGNGGLFSFTGLFRNKLLGKYRAYATSPKNSVVLRFTNRTVVVTPEDPENFAKMIEDN